MKSYLRFLVLLCGAATSSAALAYTLELATNKSCYKVGETVTVTVSMKNVTPTAAAGFQAFLAYDPLKLSFTGWSYPSSPFGLPVLNSGGLVNPSAGLVNLASGINQLALQTPSNADAVLAVVTFVTLAPDSCDTPSVWFRDTGPDPPNPPTRLSNLGGTALLPLTKNDAGHIAIDSTAPVITCPAPISVECDDSVAPAFTGTASATDVCTASPTIAYSDLYAAPLTSSGALLSSPVGWSFQTQNTARGSLVAGPGTAPLGTGSFRMITGPGGPPPPTGGKIWLTTSYYNGMRLADISTFSYSTYVTAGDPGIAPAINLYVDLDGNGTRDTTLVFEPAYVVSQQGPVVHGAWQNWNTLNGPGWWYTANFGPLTNRLNEFQTLSYYLGLFPNAQIVASGLDPRGLQVVAGQNSAGAPWSNFDGNVDNVVVNSDVYNFDPGASIIPRCSATLERTWSATDCSGNSASCLQTITISDVTDPTIACPSNISVGTNGGLCSASNVFIGETFSSPVSVGPTEALGTWYTDRYPPAVFATAPFGGDSRLHHQISAADSYTTRPGPYQSTFYNTQGRKFDVNTAIGGTISVDLFIPSSWATDSRRADLWATAFDADGQISGYPIVGFVANDPGDPFNPNPAPGNVVPRFRVYTQDTDQNPGNGYSPDWVDLGLPGGFAYDQWVTLKIALNAASFQFTIVTAQGNLSFNDAIVFGTIRFGNLMLQGYSFSNPTYPIGDTYDIYWDNLGIPAVAADNCDMIPTVTAARDDLLALSAPYPVGVTIITWTATDCSGNTSTCDQTVTVTDDDAPTITCPPDATVGTDAGACSAQLTIGGSALHEVFDVNPNFADWIVDRYPPQAFDSVSFDGGNRLRIGISSADALANRPPAYQFPFYNTQGRSHVLNNSPIGTTVSADLYIPAAWATSVRRTDLWLRDNNPNEAFARYPIIGFTSNDPADPLNPTPASPTPRYRRWDDNLGDWVNLPTPITYDAWHTLSITLSATAHFEYRIDGVLVDTDATPATVGYEAFSRLFLQAYNFGQTYDAYWDNVRTNNVGAATATDNCDLTPTITATRSDLLALSAPYPLGVTTITWTATDDDSNSVFCLQTITVVDDDPPSITCPANVIVNCGGLTDPPATGTPTAVDSCPGAVVFSYDDDRSGLTGCNATGVIVRTWTATDIAGNSVSCTQNITLVDESNPAMTACPANINVTPPAGSCSAVVTYTSPTAGDGCYDESFENPLFAAGAFESDSGGAASVNWNRSNSDFNRVPSGTDGIASRTGSFHAVIDSSTLPANPYDYSGAFTRLRGYSTSFGDGFRVTQAIYLNVNDPAVAADTYGWDLSAAVNTPANSHRRDFIFHASGKLGGASNRIVIAGSNNSNFTRRNDLLSINHYDVTSSGWYTFEWVFRDAGGGVLAVDLNLRDASDALLWTETRSDPSDIIGSTVGGNRYLWFTFLEVPKLAIDDTRLIRNVPVACFPASGSTFSLTTLVTCTATDACNNSAVCSFNVTVANHNDMLTSVELSPAMDTGGAYPQSLDRCITFSFYNGVIGPTDVDATLTFHKASALAPMIASNVIVPVPCGPYTCVTARDKRHTLRRTANSLTTNLSGQYVSNFTGDPIGGGDWLIGGNLNDDFYVDILDFGIWASQFNANFGTGDTDCNTAAPHSDISGDGVVYTPDFLFIQINFFKTHEANCVGAPGLLLAGEGNVGPISSISVAELIARGMPELAAGDVNGDGILDAYDIVWLLAGNMPQTPDQFGGEPNTPPSVVPAPRKSAEAPAVRPQDAPELFFPRHR